MTVVDLLSTLARANLAAGAAVLAVLAMRRLVRPRFGARAAYALWVAPLLAALAVAIPHPAPVRVAAEPVAPTLTAAMAEAVPAAVTAPQSPWPLILLALWLAGCAVAAGLLARRQAAYVSSLGRLEPLSASEPGVLRAERCGVGPAVVGALRPRIVAPADFEARFGAGERALILAHERVHLAAGDAGVNALAAALQCLCWFNPLAHLAARLMRVDQEFACDAAVVGRFPEARRPYAELLLKTQLVTQPLPIGCHWPARSAHPLKERIAMLKSPLPEPSMRAMGLVVAGSLALGAGGLAWAAQPGQRGEPVARAVQPISAIPGNGHLEPAEAARLVGPGQVTDCKPDANRELHNCRILGSPFARIATAADVQREWPAAAKKAGLTGYVVLRCSPNPARARLDRCEGYHFGGAAERPELKAAFEAAAIRVISIIQLKAHPGPDDDVINRTGFYTIEFNDHPHMPGGPPGNHPTTRFPDFLPGPGGKVAAPAKVSQATPPARRIPVAFAQPAAPAGSAAAAAAAFANGESPNWSRRPTLEDLMKVYPAEAQKGRVEGDVVLHCHVAMTGRLTDCGVLKETPEGAGLGAAAMALTDLFEAREQTPEGGPKRGTDIRIPFRFRLPNAPAPSTN